MSAAAPSRPGMAGVAIQRSVRWVFSDAVTIAWRNVMQVVRNPQLAVFDTASPIMFVLLFAFVFGGAIQVPGGNYVDYLLPGIFVQTVVFGATNTAVALAEDLQKGVIDRFRSLPMAPSAVLVGRTFSDTLRNFYTVLVMTIVGFVIGFRFHGSIGESILAIVLVVAFSYGIAWLSANIGLVVGSAQAAQAAIFLPIFPLTFGSSAFVPVETMPAWLQVVAKVNPVTVVVNAARGLVFGQPDWATIAGALAWSLGIVVVFAPLALIRYRRRQ